MKKFFVIGNPIEHSLSPIVHQHWFEKNNVQMSAKIKDLKNSADINWNDLENQDRVKDVKNLIKEMGRT